MALSHFAAPKSAATLFAIGELPMKMNLVSYYLTINFVHPIPHVKHVAVPSSSMRVKSGASRRARVTGLKFS